MNKPIDLAAIRRGDEHLTRAKQLQQGRPVRPVPLEEIEEMDENTLTTDEIAELLSLDVQTIRRWCRDGELPAVKLGRYYRVSRPELARWWREQGGGDLFRSPVAELADAITVEELVISMAQHDMTEEQIIETLQRHVSMLRSALGGLGGTPGGVEAVTVKIEDLTNAIRKLGGDDGK